MATRNQTRSFLELRQNFRARSPQKRAQGNGGSHMLLDGSEDVHIKIGNALPPEWVDVVESIQRDFNLIRENLRQLDRLHTSLKVSFDDDTGKQEREIDILTQEITRLLRKSEQGLKRIATIGNERGSALPPAERTVRLNVMRNIGQQLQALSKTFRRSQKDFLTKLRRNEEAGSEFFEEEAPQHEDGQEGMSEHEMMQLDEFKQSASERHQEIIRIAQSINDLATLFRELSVLVIEQGTILDRIDYNIEQTLVKVQHGTAELVIADKYSKKNRTMKCILFLSLLCIVLLIILIAKHSGGGGGDEAEGGT